MNLEKEGARRGCRYTSTSALRRKVGGLLPSGLPATGSCHDLLARHLPENRRGGAITFEMGFAGGVPSITLEKLRGDKATAVHQGLLAVAKACRPRQLERW